MYVVAAQYTVKEGKEQEVIDVLAVLNALRMAFPNPFDKSTTVVFSLNSTGPASVRVFDGDRMLDHAVELVDA